MSIKKERKLSECELTDNWYKRNLSDVELDSFQKWLLTTGYYSTADVPKTREELTKFIKATGNLVTESLYDKRWRENVPYKKILRIEIPVITETKIFGFGAYRGSSTKEITMKFFVFSLYEEENKNYFHWLINEEFDY